MARGKTNFNADDSEMQAVNGYIDGLSREIETNQYIGSVVGYVQSRLMEAFGVAADLAAAAMPESFHHVYEWGESHGDYSTVGNPAYRLWGLTATGSGANRTVGYYFKPSKRPVPIDPILLEPNERTGAVVRQGVHVFTWKAPVMEYGIRVTVKRIAPTKALAFVGSDGKIKFRKGPFSFVPGRQSNQRVFTSFYMGWWKLEAGQLFDRQISKELEANVVNEGKLKSVVRNYRTKTKSLSFRTSFEGKRTFASARAQARKDIKQKQKEYDSKAASGRMRRYGY